jgi:hypothetical protein
VVPLSGQNYKTRRRFRGYNWQASALPRPSAFTEDVRLATLTFRSDCEALIKRHGTAGPPPFMGSPS